MRDDKVPVTLKLLDLRTAEVKGQITTHRLETKAEFAKVEVRFIEISHRFDAADKRFDDMDKRFNGMDAKFDAFEQRFDAFEQKIDAKFDAHAVKFDAKFESLITLNMKTLAIVEEQNARNKFALDGYTLVYEKMIETDARLARIEKYIFGA